MSGADRRDGARDAEDELRVLLREAVPVLTAPEDRMEQVFARAARTRRRRRNAGLGLGLAGGLVAAALAAAPATAPGPEQGPAAQPAATDTGSPVRFPGIDGLTATLPQGWFAEPVNDDPHLAIGYLANRPFDPKAPCLRSAAPCGAPAAAPAPDRVLLTLRLVDASNAAERPGAATTGMTETSLSEDCSTRNGTRELVGRRSVELKGPVLIELTACAKEPSEPTLRQVQRVLDSIRTVDR